MNFKPYMRPRRLRHNPVLRKMLQTQHLHHEDLMYPIFVVSGNGVKKPIESLADQYHLSPDQAAKLAEELYQKGLRSMLLFGLPDYKDPTGTSGALASGPVQMAIRAIKEKVPQMLIATDVCLCEYTDHGHCGVLKNDSVDNDATLPLLAEQALSHALAGADMIAPSDMMDGRIGAIRQVLDDNGFEDIPIMSYSVKYAGAFYGPFRDAAGSCPQVGDRCAYQMDPARGFNEAFLENFLDVEEGADILMVKPALPYLDIIAKTKENFHLPLAAYQVSGEYAMIMAAAQAGLLDEKRTALESLLSIKRAGADIIITYFAPKVLGWLKDE